MKRAALTIAIVLVIGVAASAFADDVPMTGSAAFPAAMGKVSYNHDRNGNTRFAVHAKHLARPDALTPAKSVYVVWIQPRGKDVEKAGTLAVNSDLEGSLAGTTPYQTFDVFVTAEDGPNVERPSGPEVLRTTVQHH